MKESEFREFCAQRHLGAEQLEAAVAAVRRFLPPGPTAIRWTRRVLARASILEETSTVSPLFCYCSGGYEKLVFFSP